MLAVLVREDRAPESPASGWTRFESPVGTADALYRNLAAVQQRSPGNVIVRTADDGRAFDLGRLVATHRERGTSVTVGCVELPAVAARGGVVLGVDGRGRVVRVADRPRRPQPLPHDPSRALVAVDVYVFDVDALVDCLCVDAADPGSTHDLRSDVLPLLVRAGDVSAHVLGDAELVSRYVPT